MPEPEETTTASTATDTAAVDTTPNVAVVNTETNAATDQTTDATTKTTEAAKSIEFTDELFEAELTKRYGESGIKSKSDLEGRIKADYSKHIVPKNDFVAKAQAWDGDIETLVKISKMDLEAMDNAEAIKQDMMIKDGMPADIAKIQFDKKYAAAFVEETDEDYNAQEAQLAKYNLQKDGLTAKNSLSQWKVTETEKGQQKIDPDAAAKAEASYQENWWKPVEKAINETQKLDVNVKYELPDKTSVEEVFSYALDKPDSKKAVTDLLNSKTSEEFMTKFINMYGIKDGKPNLAGLIEPIMVFENLQEIVNHASSTAASKAVENHLKKVRPGDLSQEQRDGKKTAPIDKDQNFTNAFDAAAMAKN